MLSVFRISINLERIDEHGKNIAKRSDAIMDQVSVSSTGASLRRMGDHATSSIPEQVIYKLTGEAHDEQLSKEDALPGGGSC